MLIVGTCSLCSGPVAMYESSTSVVTAPRCLYCFAVPLNPFGPRLEMTPRPVLDPPRDAARDDDPLADPGTANWAAK